MSYPSATINPAHVTRDAQAKFNEVFDRKRAVANPIRDLFFQMGTIERNWDNYITWGSLDKVGKILAPDGRKFVSFNSYARKITVQKYGAAIALDEDHFDDAGYMPGWQEAFRAKVGEIAVDLEDLWIDFLFDALTGGTAFLPGAVKSPDGATSTVFDTTGHFGGSVINDYDPATATSFATSSLLADHDGLVNLVTTNTDDKGRELAEFGGASYTYIVPTDRVRAYAQALNAPIIGLVPTTATATTAPVASVTNMVDVSGGVKVMGWSKLNALATEKVFVVADFGNNARVNNGPPFEIVTRKNPKVRYGAPDVDHDQHRWAFDARYALRLVRPHNIYRIDKA